MKNKVKSCLELPLGYNVYEKIDLKSNKKQYLLVNGLSLLLAGIAVLVALLFIKPFGKGFTGAFTDADGMGFIKIGLVAVGAIAYIVLHELTHALVMKICLNAKINFGVSFTYAYAGSKGFYNKKSYVLIALAPLFVFLIVFSLLMIFLPKDYLFVFYLLQIFNLSGASGDIFVSLKMIKMPSDVLVNDTGMAMTVYSKENSLIADENLSENVENVTE